jgi:ferredoxin
LRPEIPKKPAEQGVPTIGFRFLRSSVEAEWQAVDGTLLEFAEESGLAPAFGCRSGMCGSCKTRIISGDVDYLEEPLAPRAHGEVLLFCSVPQQRLAGKPNSAVPELVLDL